MTGHVLRSQFSKNYSQLINWQGGSGRAYATVGQAIDRFVLDDTGIYILVVGGLAAWVGTARDLIEDHVSRTKFRTSILDASIALRVNNPVSETERMCLTFDLEAGHQIAELTAA